MSCKNSWKKSEKNCKWQLDWPTKQVQDEVMRNEIYLVTALFTDI